MVRNRSHVEGWSSPTGKQQRGKPGLSTLLKRLKKSPEQFKEYDEKIRSQLEEGIVEIAPEEPTGKECYIPHKAVIREEAESTKMRVV